MCPTHTHFYLLLFVCAGRTWLIIRGLLFYIPVKERGLSRGTNRRKKKKKEVDDRRREKQRGTRMSSTHFAATLREEITNKTVPSSNSRENFALSLSLPLFWSRATANGICQDSFLSLPPQRCTEGVGVTQLLVQRMDHDPPPETWTKKRTRLWSIRTR